MNFGTTRVDLHLGPHSPCIDAADPSVASATDLDGNTRIGAPDMGAYELVPSN